MHPTDPLAVAARLFAAVEAGDVAAVAQLYAPDAVIWHSHTGTTQTAAENVQVLGVVTRRLRDMR
jgi:ketosteroid isomerase-like protein